ncbi:oxidoreductase [Rhizodiscina lignyota]|uniref:Oxidoreductase n=1 Tax=Rhizodiscina lignyota TaxID=1504668 RepID=A0A9P4MBE6_9PEZI|nr:oxidoreductase [Rhizodiscina lignyota]
MSFPYKHVLMVGATSGIGKALADRMIKEGLKVTVTGRRNDRLEAFVKEYGEEKASMIAFDIADTQNAPKFAAETMSKFPDIDCVFLNAGIQRRHMWGKPASVDLAEFNNEFHVNFTSFVALTHAFLPLLEKQQFPTSIVYTGTHIAIVPAITLSGYSASKAALNSFTLCLRFELANAGSNIKIIELSPPPVQSELHDYMPGGRNFGMPVDQFTELAWKGLASGDDQIIIGDLGPPGSKGVAEPFKEIVPKRREVFETLSGIVASHMR